MLQTMFLMRKCIKIDDGEKCITDEEKVLRSEEKVLHKFKIKGVTVGIILNLVINYLFNLVKFLCYI